MVSRHESAKSSASFHCMVDVFCQSCGLVYCSGCVPLFLALMWYHVNDVVVGCGVPWEPAKPWP